MKKLLSLISLVLTLVMICPVNIAATAERHDDMTMSEVNSLHAEEVSPEDLVFEDTATPCDAEPQVYHSTLEDYSAELRQNLVDRKTTFTVSYKSSEAFSKEFYTTTLNLAFAHTGVPNEGDYLNFTWKSYNVSGEYSKVGNIYYYDFTYTFVYYTTAEQEAMVDTAVDTVLSEIINDANDDYSKVCAIYDYICSTVTYDYENLNDENYILKWSAYAALINKTAVCQGYANLFYRLCLECGIDSRIIAGVGDGERHAWNIVQLDGYYYNLDATWDSSRKQVSRPYDYFLKSDIFFYNHTPDSEYLENDFTSVYVKPLWNYNKNYPAHRHVYSASPIVVVYATAENDGLSAKVCACGHMIDVNTVTYKDSKASFNDLKVNSWSKKSIDFVVSNGIMSGTSKNSFSQTGKTTRAMFVTILWKLEGSPAATKACTFKDLEKKQTWYHEAVAWASEKGIVYGSDSTHFNPTGYVTREQIATFLYRYAANIKGEDTTGRADLSSFPDNSKVSAFAKDALAWANKEGIINGKSVSGKAYLKPSDNATREEVAVMITGFCTK